MDTGFFDGVDWPGLLGKALAAVAILVITWIVAMIVKSLFTKLSSKIPALQRAGAEVAGLEFLLEVAFLQGRALLADHEISVVAQA